MESDETRDSDPQTTKQRKRHSWSKEESQCMLRLYNTNANDVGPNHTFRSKLHLWNEIAKRLNKTYQNNRSTLQCIGQYKTLQRNNFNGSRSHFGMQSNVSSQEMVTSEEEFETNESANNDTQPARIDEIIRSTLLEIHKLKEEAKERRHRERMALLEKFLLQGSANQKATAQVEIALDEIKTEEKMLKPIVFGAQKQQHQHQHQHQQHAVQQHQTQQQEQDHHAQQTQQHEQSQQQESLGNDNQVMRARLLEMQRKKMEDRERKKKISVIASKQLRLSVRDFK